MNHIYNTLSTGLAILAVGTFALCWAVWLVCAAILILFFGRKG